MSMWTLPGHPAKPAVVLLLVAVGLAYLFGLAGVGRP